MAEDRLTFTEEEIARIERLYGVKWVEMDDTKKLFMGMFSRYVWSPKAIANMIVDGHKATPDNEPQVGQTAYLLMSRKNECKIVKVVREYKNPDFTHRIYVTGAWVSNFSIHKDKHWYEPMQAWVLTGKNYTWMPNVTNTDFYRIMEP